MTSVSDLFAHAGATYGGAVRWGNQVLLDAPGVYVVSTMEDPAADGGFAECPLDLEAVAQLIAARPEATIDGQHADPLNLSRRLRAMWLPGESVAYIGLASKSVRTRISQFYATAIGARAPHAGGWPIKMLDDSAGLWAHFGLADDPDKVEAQMIRHFAEGVPREVRRSLIDPSAPLPFANLTFPRGRRKRHGIRGVKERRRQSGSDVTPKRDKLKNMPPDGIDSPRSFTQNVTAADVRNRQIRVPAASKMLFPSEPTRLKITIQGEVFDASWNPRTSGDRERSGVIRFVRGEISGRISEGGPRVIQQTEAGLSIL